VHPTPEQRDENRHRIGVIAESVLPPELLVDSWGAAAGPLPLELKASSGKRKTSVRIVLGVASLSLGVPVELEVILEVAE
jgi:hypothetical protein